MDKVLLCLLVNICFLVKGFNFDVGGGEIIIYEFESGGVVFLVGLICWISCVFVDEVVLRIIENVVW